MSNAPILEEAPWQRKIEKKDPAFEQETEEAREEEDDIDEVADEPLQSKSVNSHPTQTDWAVAIANNGPGDEDPNERGDDEEDDDDDDEDERELYEDAATEGPEDSN